MNKKKKTFVFVSMFLVLIAAGLYATTTILASPKEGTCLPLPSGNDYVQINKGVYTVEGTGELVYVLRGIALGESESSKLDGEEILPPCFSDEPGLETFRNIVLIDENGNRVIMLKGVGGGRGAESGVDTSPLP